MTVSEVLYGAADHIERYGLCRGKAFAYPQNYSTSPACVLGAIGVADRAHFSAESVRAVADHLGIIATRVHMWSDRTPEHKVIETLRAVALIESAREQTRDHVVTTSANHVRIVAARHDLELVEADGYLLATLFVPALGEAIVYQAPVAVSA